MRRPTCWYGTTSDKWSQGRAAIEEADGLRLMRGRRETRAWEPPVEPPVAGDWTSVRRNLEIPAAYGPIDDSAGRRCCVAGAGIGALGVLAWLSGFGGLTAIIPGQPPMMPNTALGLLLLGVGGALRAPENAGRAAKAASVIAALFVLAVGVATLAEYLLAIDLGSDPRSSSFIAGSTRGVRRRRRRWR